MPDLQHATVAPTPLLVGRICRAVAAALIALAVLPSPFAPAFAEATDDVSAPREEEETPPEVPKARKPMAEAQERKPLWEFGIAGGAGLLPDYPASDESGFRGVAFPYVIYRGGIFRLGEKGIARGRVVREEDLDIDLSLGAAFPVDSEDNEARRGMPDLDFVGEIGPRIEWTFARPDPNTRLKLELPLRVVFSVDLEEVAYRGLLIQPRLVYERTALFGTQFSPTISAGPIIASERFHDYFYEVEPRFARAGRPAYEASGGYLGTQVSGSVTWKATPDFAVFIGVQVGIFGGAANEDSPLFRDEITFATGVGFAWTFWESERRERD